jgi:hypothetical protein
VSREGAADCQQSPTISRAPDGDVAYSLLEAGGCSGSQIVESVGLGDGHLKHGLSQGELQSWIASLES